MAFGGWLDPANTAVTEEWNGTNWTEVNDLNSSRQAIRGLGTYTAALAVGGYTTTVVASTEEWNGVSWVETSDLATARSNGGASGSSSAGLYFGGGTPTKSAITEEWNVPSNTVKTLTD